MTHKEWEEAADSRAGFGEMWVLPWSFPDISHVRICKEQHVWPLSNHAKVKTFDSMTNHLQFGFAINYPNLSQFGTMFIMTPSFCWYIIGDSLWLWLLQFAMEAMVHRNRWFSQLYPTSIYGWGFSSQRTVSHNQMVVALSWPCHDSPDISEKKRRVQGWFLPGTWRDWNIAILCPWKVG